MLEFIWVSCVRCFVKSIMVSWIKMFYRHGNESIERLCWYENFCFWLWESIFGHAWEMSYEKWELNSGDCIAFSDETNKIVEHNDNIHIICHFHSEHYVCLFFERFCYHTFSSMQWRWKKTDKCTRDKMRRSQINESVRFQK